MELVNYKPWHYEYLMMITSNGRLLGEDIVKMYALAYSFKGQAYTIKDNGRVVGCAGIVELWPGVGEAWTVLSKDLKGNPFFLHRKTYRIMRNLINKFKYHRLQAIVCPGDSIATKWIERLGFKKESIMKRFGADGSDHAMYVWEN